MPAKKAASPWWNPRQKCYKIGRIPLRGITLPLRDLYWPDYRLPSSADSNSSSASKKGSKGKARGSLVGRQIAKWASSKAVPPRSHPYTRSFVNFCSVNKLTPIKGEFAVGDLESRLGTGVDVMASRKETDETGKIRSYAFPMEIKSGMSSCFRSSTGRMRGAMRDVDNSPAMQARIQLAVTMALLFRCRPNVLCRSGAVVHITDAGCTPTVYTWEELKPLATKALSDLTSGRCTV